MKPLFLLSACGLALMSLSACGPSTPATARVALDCPSDQGDLKLATTAADKKTCTYASRNGDEVSLRLIPVSSTYEAALLPIETELQGEQEAAQPATSAKPADTPADTPTSKSGAAKTSASEAANAAKQAASDALGGAHSMPKEHDEDSDHVSIAGGAITADSGGARGDHANINLPGIHISADDNKANVSVGGVHVDAGEDGATVRMTRDVRLRGEAFSRERHGFRATYILAKDNLKNGWKAVGYEAAGPKAGPITVAVFTAHQGDHHDVSYDYKRLVRKNAGV
jgi:hypothetical protein